MANLHDTHFHLDLQKSRNEAIKHIEKYEIYTIAMTNLPPLYEKLQNETKCKFLRVALGFHPELIGQYQKYIPDMWRLLPSAKYIGEVGLDYKADKLTKSIQSVFFESLISKCNEIGDKIISIHSRMASLEVTSIIGDNFKGKIILHWYSGSINNQITAIKNGYYFSVNSAMLQSDSGRKIVSNIPEDKILLETDSPFVKSNGVINNQYDQIYHTIEMISKLMNKDWESTKILLWSNLESLIKN